ncbi:unnamed protein product [Candida verbasci]|uniref:Uncharacterized protein n=1 Tax=Candida verbasci TaxID=1227364 RepID=A0A9W4TX57_9ASCO|nr:unnamed protein product [Candida verbasci]
MKFAEALNEGLVPEWQDQYVSYKQGKKLIKKCKKLKDEYDFDGGEQLKRYRNDNTNNDRTPLLEPSIPEPTYSSDNNEPTEPVRLSRRPSIFNYSLKSSSNKKEEYLKESKKFQIWLDQELRKVEEFYREKEQEVYERYLLIQDQLYQMKDQKAQIIIEKSKHDNNEGDKNIAGDVAFHTKFFFTELNRYDLPSLPSMRFLQKWKQKRRRKRKEDEISLQLQDETDLNYAENRVRNGLVQLSADDSSTIRPESSNEQMSIDSEIDSNIPDQPQHFTPEQIRQQKRRDYSIKKQHFGVPYLYARKQLKSAILEHYRALSLLKSYKILNRTAFRKITKKFDKAMDTHIMDKFLNKIDQNSYFLISDLIDKIITHVEELYINFFDPETKDRKHSLEKLKTIAYAVNASEMRQEYYGEFFTSGILLGFGIPLFVLALYTGLHKTLNSEISEGTFLLQIWGGFFLLNLAFLLFAINMAVFEKFKINYKFIFEFNMATALNYKQFWLLPSFGFAFLSLIGWFSLNNFWPTKFPGRDWPWIYFAVMIIIVFWPGNQLYASSRKWLQIAIWRIVFSGFYPVEFRDFFLGDIICSLTYTMGNISFFFCLYAHHWDGTLSGQPSYRNTCGSNRSQLMGFFSTLPSIFRFMQCIRRYMDTGDWFPHLANMLKYTMSAIYYITLSVYRINNNTQNKIAFIIFAFINSIYTSVWDIVMDWSLLQFGSKNFLLRDNLFYKNPIYYYIAMVSDVILRFQWVFYAFFSHQIQQSAITSFIIAIAEIVRRFIWIFFRMENEHCTNVVLFRASKNTPLPYVVSNKVEKAIKQLVELKYLEFEENLPEVETTEEVVDQEPYTTGRRTSIQDEEGTLGLTRRTSTTSLPSIQRKKSVFKQFTDTLNTAHIKDFQRRKTKAHHEDDSDDDDDEEEEEMSLPSTRRTVSKGSKLASLREEDE